MIAKWDKQRSNIIGDYRIFRLRQDDSRSPRTDRIHTFYVLETGDWVNIIPITPEGKVVLIEQFRHGNGDLTVEVPGGMVDPEDDSPAESAMRELREETGYIAESCVHLGSVTPNPAILNNQCHTFLAKGARQVQAPQFDGTEDIRVFEVDLAEIPEMIRHGRIHHALVVAAFYHLDNYLRQRAT